MSLAQGAGSVASDCLITEAERLRAGTLATRALDATRVSGAESKLTTLSAQSSESAAGPETGPGVASSSPEQRAAITDLGLVKRHDLIAYYRAQGLQDAAVVEALADHGFKIKVADVRANAKWYGTAKITASDALLKQFPDALGTAASDTTTSVIPVNDAESTAHSVVPIIEPPPVKDAPYNEAKARNYLRKRPVPVLTEDEFVALDRYQGGPYAAINAAQRNFSGDAEAFVKSTGMTDVSDLTSYLKETIMNGRAAIQKATPLDHSIMVYRSVEAASDVAFTRVEYGAMLEDNSLGVGVARRANIEALAVKKLQGLTGGVIEDKGFVSTTTSRRQAERWLGRTSSRPGVVFRIHLPTGTRGLWMEHVADQSQFVVQQEFLLGPSRFKVVNVDAALDAAGEQIGNVVIDLELLPP